MYGVKKYDIEARTLLGKITHWVLKKVQGCDSFHTYQRWGYRYARTFIFGIRNLWCEGLG